MKDWDIGYLQDALVLTRQELSRDEIQYCPLQHVSKDLGERCRPASCHLAPIICRTSGSHLQFVLLTTDCETDGEMESEDFGLRRLVGVSVAHQLRLNWGNLEARALAALF